ncbi:MAG: RNA polymerase sigma factor [Chloroflexi bacterium]|nr:RNA polymerase sigma factor [Chloroflexota bacterium]
MSKERLSAGCEDERLLMQVRQGNLLAFGDLYHKYRGLVYRTALAIVRDAEAAEDILQDCFLRLHAHAGSLDGTSPLSPWLYRVTANLCYNWLHQRARWQSPDDKPLAQACSLGQESPEALLERQELRLAVEQALSRLSASHRAVVVLFYLADFSVEEVAQTLDCPVGTVKSRLHYARSQLRTLIEQGEAFPLVEVLIGVRG